MGAWNWGSTNTEVGNWSKKIPNNDCGISWKNICSILTCPEPGKLYSIPNTTTEPWGTITSKTPLWNPTCANYTLNFSSSRRPTPIEHRFSKLFSNQIGVRVFTSRKSVAEAIFWEWRSEYWTCSLPSLYPSPPSISTYQRMWSSRRCGQGEMVSSVELPTSLPGWGRNFPGPNSRVLLSIFVYPLCVVTSLLSSCLPHCMAHSCQSVTGSLVTG